MSSTPVQQPGYFIKRIQNALDGLPEAERKVMALACKNPRAFLEMSAEQAAAMIEVSKPTVVRACRRVGYQGLSEFKRHLAVYLGSASDLPYVSYSFKHEDDIENLSVNLSTNLIAAVDAFRKAAGFGSIQLASQWIVETQNHHGNLLLLGVGNSGIVALDAQHKFFHLGIHCTVCLDTYQQVITTTMAKAHDCLLVFSTSGRTTELIEAARIAKQRKVKVIAITKNGTSLAQVADLVIAVEHDEDSDMALPMVSRVLQLLVVDILFMSIASKFSPGLANQLKELEKNIKQKRGQA
jgi:RpiR family carbohydrate utilization transcriptional regulator